MSAADMMETPAHRPPPKEAWHWSDTLTSDYWNPPENGAQYRRQRAFAVLLAFIAASLLTSADS